MEEMWGKRNASLASWGYVYYELTNDWSTTGEIEVTPRSHPLVRCEHKCEFVCEFGNSRAHSVEAKFL